METLINLLKEHKLTIGSCESLTAGLFTSQLAEVSGASAVLKGGIVTYMTSCKLRVVGVDEAIVKKYGVISSECAVEMAKKTKQLLDVDICVSFTGNAGPEAMENKRAGLVYCAFVRDEAMRVFECEFDGTRNDVRQKAVDFMVEELIKELQNKGDS